jgi:ubiquinone/menaquinone biosynthesis C-methylase UbiE
MSAKNHRSETVEDGYDRIYKQYDSYRSISANRRELNDFLKLLPTGSKVLDIGCGSGKIAKYLTDHGHNLVGIDISRNMLKLAKHAVPAAEFHKQDVCDLDFPEGSFDGALALYSIIHVPRKYHFGIFKKINRILKPKGIALISVGGSNLENYIDENWMNWGSRMYWSHFELEKNLILLRKSGFKIISRRLSGMKGDKHPFGLASKV